MYTEFLKLLEIQNEILPNGSVITSACQTKVDDPHWLISFHTANELSAHNYQIKINDYDIEVLGSSNKRIRKIKLHVLEDNLNKRYLEYMSNKHKDYFKNKDDFRDFNF